jgi:hypothetical protein
MKKYKAEIEYQVKATIYIDQEDMQCAENSAWEAVRVLSRDMPEAYDGQIVDLESDICQGGRRTNVIKVEESE